MVFLFYLVIILNIIIVLLISSKIRIEIINFGFSSLIKKHIKDNYEIVIKLCILKKIPILKIRLTKEKLEKSKMKDRLKQIDLEAIQNQKKINKNLLKNIKRVKMEIQKIDLKIELGTENASLTSIIVPVISTIIAIYLRKKIEDFANQKFIINPIYTNQNLIKIDISGIFEIKLIHIINMIYVLTKKGEVKEYERSSNRRTYDYSYE